MHKVFAFECKAGKPLARIPMVIRRKLDVCGVKLTMRGWASLGQEEKWLLVRKACESPEEQSAYRQLLLQFAGVQITAMDPAPDAADEIALSTSTEVPAQVVLQCGLHGLPAPCPGRWPRLDALQRYALVKLSRPGHHNEHFLPAIEEFDLLELSKL
ncbi:nitrate reductase associated protein [Massilia sp. GCM10023247]